MKFIGYVKFIVWKLIIVVWEFLIIVCFLLKYICYKISNIIIIIFFLCMGWEFVVFFNKEILMLCVGDLIKGMWNDKKMIYLILIDEGLIIFGFFI